MIDAAAPMIRSARAIVVEDAAVLLIERRRAGRHYWVFPGGKLEPGETDAAAVVREVEEETGLVVAPGRLVAEVAFPDRVQTFWLCTVVGGAFGTGTGPEMTGAYGAERGTYWPVWLPVDDLPNGAVYPTAVVEILRASVDCGWRTDAVRLSDDAMWWT